MRISGERTRHSADEKKTCVDFVFYKNVSLCWWWHNVAMAAALVLALCSLLMPPPPTRFLLLVPLTLLLLPNCCPIIVRDHPDVSSCCLAVRNRLHLCCLSNLWWPFFFFSLRALIFYKTRTRYQTASGMRSAAGTACCKVATGATCERDGLITPDACTTALMHGMQFGYPLALCLSLCLSRVLVEDIKD